MYFFKVLIKIVFLYVFFTNFINFRISGKSIDKRCYFGKYTYRVLGGVFM